LIDYDRIVLTVRFSRADNISGIRAIWTTGDLDQPLIQSSFRLLYSISILVALVLLMWRLRNMSFKIWHLEQKLTLFLLVFAFFADDPLDFIEQLEVTAFAVYYDILSSSCFHIYLLFFILVLFDSLRFKNRKTDSCFCVPKILFFCTFLTIEVIHRFGGSSGILLWRFNEKNERLVRAGRVLCEVISCVWIMGAVFFAGRFTDVTEQYKFSVYAGVCLVAVTVLGALEFLVKHSIFFQQNSLTFVIPFSVPNFFVLLMAIFHWPYEVLVDQQYEDTGTADMKARIFMAD
jgi:hypothetical protein